MATESRSDPPKLAGVALKPTTFASLPGWAEDRHDLAFDAFRRGCDAAGSLRSGLPAPPALAMACAQASHIGRADAAMARGFFERWFTAMRLELPIGHPSAGSALQGFLTGYFEPEFDGSLVRNGLFQTPLLGRPPELVTLEQGVALPGLQGLQAALRRADGSLVPAPTRSEIETTAVAAGWPVVAWLRDPVDRFIMQVQGSARLRLPDGSVARVAYAGRNGHPYTSLGRVLSQTESIPPAQVTMDRLVARLKDNPAWAATFMRNNASFVFFRLATELDAAAGPIGGQGVSLTAHRSIAADRTIWPYGVPVWLSGTVPTADRTKPEPLRRLTIIQDTGSAIIGPGRFDLFFGAGPDAGFVAGLTRHPVEAVVLWPRETADGVR